MNTGEAESRAGVTTRQLNYWLSKGFLSADGRPAPSFGSGNIREISYNDFRRLDKMARLVRAAVKPDAAARMARAMVESGNRAVDLPGGVRVVLLEASDLTEKKD